MNILFTLIFSLISAAALILIYSIRARRRPRKVSALFLWQSMIHTSADQQIFKRFFREKLFYLHTAILILLLAALIYSGMAKPLNTGQRLIFIIDVSASMKAIENGESRLALAKKKALSLLENYEGTEAMIISAGKPFRNMPEFVRDQGNIREAISKIEAEDTAADIHDTLLMIKPYMRESDHIYLISDGSSEDITSLIGQTPNLIFLSVGETSDNAGIQALDIYPKEDNAYMSVEVSLKNFSKVDLSSTVDLLYDGKVIDAQHIELGSGNEKRMIFGHVPLLTGSITARLNHKDALSSDNYRYAVLSAPTLRSVLLVTKDNFFLSSLLKCLKNYRVSVLSPQEYEKDIQAPAKNDHDIGIYDNYVPSSEMSRAAIYINPGKDIYGIRWEDLFFAPEDIYSLREHPVMHYTDFSDISIQRARRVRAFEGLAVLGSSASPLIIISNVQGKDRAVLGFDIKDSNFPKSVNFPVFFSNLMSWIDPDKDDEKHSISCGETFNTRISDRSISGKTAIQYPDGKEMNLKIEDNMLRFSDTSTAGIYSISDEGLEIRFAANIPSAESDIRPVEYTAPPEEISKTNMYSSIYPPVIWKIFGILAILLLLSEKWIRERLT